MTTLTQRTFSSGEVSPSLYARVDTIKYATGLRTCFNCMVLRYGGVSNRAGTNFVSEVSNSQQSVRLVPFVFNQDQTYVLEFGEYYMRVIRNGSALTDIDSTIETLVLGTQTSIYAVAHGFSTGDEVYLSGVQGTIELNNRNFKVLRYDDDNYELRSMSNEAFDSSSYTAWIDPSGTASRIYEIVTPYTALESKEFKYVQSADVITIAHNSHKPQEVLRYGSIDWEIQEVSFAPKVSYPTGIALSGGAVGAETFKYTVTAIDTDGEESLPSTDATALNIYIISNANPAVVETGVAHGLIDGDVIVMDDTIVGMEELNSKHFQVEVLTTLTFILKGIDTTDINSYSSGGIVTKAFSSIASKAIPTTSTPIVVAWDSVPEAVEYNIYAEVNGTYALLGITSNTTFNDIGQSADASISPPNSLYPFIVPSDYPSVVTYIQQRLVFANTLNDPEKIFMSKTSDFKNFNKSRPSQDNDAINFQMAGKQVNAVKNLLDIGSFLIMTSGGEWSASGNEAGVLTPTSINTKQASYNGSGDLLPIIIDGAAIYQQARGSIIRDLGYDYQVDGYRGNDLTIFSSHLFDKFTIVDWAYQQIPHSILWVVRSDGALLGMTFVRNQEIRAWHIHDLGGECESVTVVPEGNEDFLYVQIKRVINGKTVRYIEKLNSRLVRDIKDNKFMDSALTYDGRNTNDSWTVNLTGGVTWEYTESLTLTASDALFRSTDIGNEIHITDSLGDVLRVEITAYTSDLVVTVKPKKTVPATLRATAVSTWTKAVDELVGLWHIEGEEVSIMGDGYVVASPNNDSYVTVSVSNGRVILDKPYGVIHVGLPYLADIETLDIDTANGETLADKDKIVNKVNMYVEDTRGIWSGPKPPSDSTVDPLESLVEMKIRNEEDYDSPVSLKTDVIGVNIEAEWNSNGRIFIRQVDPIPMSILSINPAGKFPIG